MSPVAGAWSVARVLFGARLVSVGAGAGGAVRARLERDGTTAAIEARAVVLACGAWIAGPGRPAHPRDAGRSRGAAAAQRNRALICPQLSGFPFPPSGESSQQKQYQRFLPLG